MDTEKLRAYCGACLPEQWEALEGADRSKVISGNALVVQGHQLDVNAIVAFANAMPELLDTIERQAKEISNLKKAFADDQDVLGGLLQERDAALAEVEQLK